ncbi:hypothetical protein PF005_g23752 [Phytophthora fragariae]|uniref:Secreted protein n=1 Tax=Phytophthora fragariae TaxID=53985 RepID=A0A6A3DXW0_9STRA|nr:hypothetical protein PF003_g1951 [Phytophthora fragariae]KAE8926544.1 hypothetical protein PF009_g23265 [Phytophthora fragariae]KAE8998311.1 hypothetical protein PF011_g15107 [Phytophthora fragariae]KAE9081226.1 hypothetical protein PF007_g22745 [Phytophthora fragariae]KAE9082498.1 hypothetical protein PF010_g21560 [Phytophthora fragariae]
MPSGWSTKSRAALVSFALNVGGGSSLVCVAHLQSNNEKRTSAPSASIARGNHPLCGCSPQAYGWMRPPSSPNPVCGRRAIRPSSFFIIVQ